MSGDIGQPVALIGITPVLGPGPHSIGVACNDIDTEDDIDYDQASVKVVALSPG